MPKDAEDAAQLIVPVSKTEAGKGRVVPLTARVAAELGMWRKRFPTATMDSFVFPRHRVGQPKDGSYTLYDVNLTEPMLEWKTSWAKVCEDTGLHFRWHDLRHTFISRLAENPAVSEQTIRELAGHVSREMLQRYSHIRMEAKVQAIAALAVVCD